MLLLLFFARCENHLSVTWNYSNPPSKFRHPVGITDEKFARVWSRGRKNKFWMEGRLLRENTKFLSAWMHNHMTDLRIFTPRFHTFEIMGADYPNPIQESRKRLSIHKTFAAHASGPCGRQIRMLGLNGVRPLASGSVHESQCDISN